MRFWTTIGLITVLSALGLTYEIAAGRVLAPFFGTSLLTWTTVIAVVLAGFALGSALGGFVAERPRNAALRASALALVATAALMAASPIILSFIYSMGARGTVGMVLSVILAFLPASVLVTIPSPFLAKLAVEARPGREGSSLGIVLAAGSVGAIAGAVLAGFVMLPLAGSVATFAGCGAVALTCLIVLRRAGTRPPPGGVLFAIAALVLSLAAGPACRYESGLSCIDVVDAGPDVLLFSDRTLQAAERRDGSGEMVLGYTGYVWSRLDTDLEPDANVLFIGGGGYTLPARLLVSRAEARATVVEIDPLVTQVVRDRLEWAGGILAAEGEAGGRLTIIHADGRTFLNETGLNEMGERFDAVVLDAFSSGSVPAHLATLEVHERLDALTAGPVYVNLLDTPDGSLARGVTAILHRVHENVEVVEGPVGRDGLANTVIAAGPRPLAPLASLPPNYAHAIPSPARPFTDDRGWIGHR